jgi:hypothetical protein
MTDRARGRHGSFGVVIEPCASVEQPGWFPLREAPGTGISGTTRSGSGVILVRDRLDMAQAIAAGRAWQRLHLALTAEGLSAQPLNQPVEMIDRHQMLGRSNEFDSALAKRARTEGWEATFVFRLGYAVREGLRSPRRPLADVTR